mmetsp:Transcript_23351/g.32656  ORF Transcript_23351/g.32656 Transcript_23351/m.32656 type:complete len:361 (+) Transcript_23351:70-1152(+)
MSSWNFGGGGNSYGSGMGNSGSMPDTAVELPANTDSISSLTFNPRHQDVLIASTWDNKLMAWQVGAQMGKIQSKAHSQITNKGPVLCTAVTPEGDVLSGGACCTASKWTIGQQQTQQIAKHDKPISCINFCTTQPNLVATACWGKKLRLWDGRTPRPVRETTLEGKAYSMDSRGSKIVVACSGRKIQIFDLRNQNRTWQTKESSLKNQIRCVSIFPNVEGYAAGSICGRVAITNFKERDSKKNFMFKCHRKKEIDSSNKAKVYAVNAIEFHPKGTFATAGSDGQFVFWDKDSRQRLQKFDLPNETPISACAFNKTGNLFAYAVSYDWSKGFQNRHKYQRNEIRIHVVKDSEIHPQMRRHH